VLSFTRKTNSAALAFLTAGAVWFVVGTTYGAFSAIHFVAPDFFANIPALVFGRTRPAHVNTVIFGFVTSALFGCMLYIVPALLKTRLWSERLGWFSFICWNVAVLSGPITFAQAITQGREYTEYVFAFDVLIVLAMLGFIVNLVMTVVNRRENALYVSVWYFMGMALWTAGVYPIGNVMWAPSAGALPGLLDSILLWFYGHNLVGLLLTPMAVATAYFVVPRVARTPLYSHTLSLIGFWTLVSLYTHIGGHHLIQAPIPNWLKTLSTVDSMMMFIPVAAVLANIWLTARGRSHLLWNDPPGRLVLVGTIWYLFTCIQGPVQSLPSVQQITHFNNWVIGHAHIAVLGFSGLIALGGMWHVLPLITGKQLYSRRLVNLQFGLVMFGVTGFFVVLTAAGLVQGSAWYNGESVYRVLPQLWPYMALRALSGMFIITGAFVGLANLLLTFWKGQPLQPGPSQEQAAGESGLAATTEEGRP
jgi:cbb3-type cytochrome c oxidase subunit I